MRDGGKGKGKVEARHQSQKWERIGCEVRMDSEAKRNVPLADACRAGLTVLAGQDLRSEGRWVPTLRDLQRLKARSAWIRYAETVR